MLKRFGSVVLRNSLLPLREGEEGDNISVSRAGRRRLVSAIQDAVNHVVEVWGSSLTESFFPELS
ncbi:hypothetical protein C450_20606 [Halococcus salifodinae DSM 8989]|uniref:Uncharacterized protein n=1 Tax=Halococcus salifodinae DSM 8989 TaxID=1227456 RepID=M0MQX7_9EURY|nr:hypothetical protein C450_20606 [Halococcus salifodinae DSM 8989]